MTTLCSHRLVLRPLSEDDLPSLVAWRNDPEVSRYQGWVLPYTLEMARSLLGEGLDLGADGWVQRAISSPTGELLGDLGMCTEGAQAEVGITLRPGAQRQGYAAEAMRTLLGHAFGPLGVRRVFASIDPRNAPVARLLERSGFRLEARLERSYLHRGAWVDEDVYAVLRDG
ncbi:MAG: N-acetyltransferase [Myxococcaceae bacterium]|nr:MAG: N-acetyltransferase [Myxococcaceae bacterium]